MSGERRSCASCGQPIRDGQPVEQIALRGPGTALRHTDWVDCSQSTMADPLLRLSADEAIDPYVGAEWGS